MQVFVTFLLDVRCLPQLFFHLIFIAQNRIVRHKTQEIGRKLVGQDFLLLVLTSPLPAEGISDRVILDAD